MSSQYDNVEEEKFFTKITYLHSNNFYGGIYNMKSTSKKKIFVMDWQSMGFMNYDTQEQLVQSIQRYRQYELKVPISKIYVGKYYVFAEIPQMKTYMFLPLEEKLQYVDYLLNMIDQLAKTDYKPAFNNYLINEETNEIQPWEFVQVKTLSADEYLRYLQVCFVIQLVCKNALECNQFQIQARFKDMIQRLDDFAGTEEKAKSCPIKWWRVFLRPYYIYERYIDVNLFQMFVNTPQQNKKMISQLIQALRKQVVKIY